MEEPRPRVISPNPYTGLAQRFHTDGITSHRVSLSFWRHGRVDDRVRGRHVIGFIDNLELMPVEMANIMRLGRKSTSALDVR